MKASIYQPAKSKTWTLLYYRPCSGIPGLVAISEQFMFWDGAINRWNKLKDKVKREQKALKYLKQISLTWLSVREHHFISKLQRSKCRGISQRQYGYLKGIWERQQ